MRLIDLEPRWIHHNVFVFLCPHCRKILLSCKNVAMSEQDQINLFKKEFGEWWNLEVILSRDSTAWAISGTRPLDPRAAFPDNITVTPSIDASPSGHWHGFITNGLIT